MLNPDEVFLGDPQRDAVRTKLPTEASLRLRHWIDDELKKNAVSEAEKQIDDTLPLAA